MASQDTSLLGRQLDHLQISDSAGGRTHPSDGDYPLTVTSTTTNSESSSSPVACLATELLARVFVAALPVVHTAQDVKALSMRQAPLNVSHVCKFWRDVALSTPQLWVQIFFDARNYYDKSDIVAAMVDTVAATLELFSGADKRRVGRFEDAKSVASSIRAFLERSGSQVLYVNVRLFAKEREVTEVKRSARGRRGRRVTRPNMFLEGDGLTFPITTSHALTFSTRTKTDLEAWERLGVALAPLLLRSQHRWKMASICSVPGAWYRWNRDSCTTNTRTAQIHGWPTEERYNFKHFPVLDLSNGHHLECLTIEAEHENTIIQTGELSSFSTLSSFNVCGALKMEEITKLLIRSPQLCKLVFNLWGQRDVTTETVTRLQKLVEFNLTLSKQDAANRSVVVLDQLSMPSLERLTLQAGRDVTDAKGIGTHVLSLVRRSRSRLTELSITFSSTVGPGYDIFVCLMAAPFLRKLSLHMFAGMDIFLGMLLASTGGRNHCPMLQYLTLRPLSHNQLSLAIQIAKSRSPRENESYPRAETVDGGTSSMTQALHGTSILLQLHVDDRHFGRRTNENTFGANLSVADRVIVADLCRRGLQFSISPYNEKSMSFGDEYSNDDT